MTEGQFGRSIATCLVAFAVLSHADAHALSCGDTVSSSTTLSSNLSGCTGHGLVIASSGITLTCAPGVTITGTGSGPSRYGVYARNTSLSDVQVIGCDISGFVDAIRFENVSTTTAGASAIVQNDVHDNSFYGINLTRSRGVLVELNTVTGNDDEGIHVSGQLPSNVCPSSHLGENTIRDNTVTSTGIIGDADTGEGIYVLCSDANRVEDNTISDNFNVGVNIDEQSSSNLVLNNTLTNDGLTIKESSNNAVVGNTISGDPAADSLSERFSFDGATSNYAERNLIDVNDAADECFRLINGGACNQVIASNCLDPVERNIRAEGAATIDNRFFAFVPDLTESLCTIASGAKADVYDTAHSLIGCAGTPQVIPGDCAWWAYDELCDDGTTAGLGDVQANAPSWDLDSATVTDTQYYRANDGEIRLSVAGPLVVSSTGCLSVSSAAGVELRPGTQIQGRFRAVVM